LPRTSHTNFQSSKTFDSSSNKLQLSKQLKGTSITSFSLPDKDDWKSVSDTDSKASLLKPLIAQQIRKRATLSTLSKSLKPRPSVLFNDKLQRDSFVPGADPFNFIEQDRKLGYQKSRMWFPTAMVVASASLLPFGRTDLPAKGFSERVVQEFLQMRALASYVGDVVLPYEPHRTEGGGSSNSSEVSVASGQRLTGFTKAHQFDWAVQEALRVWNPLHGVRIPQWTKSDEVSVQRQRQTRFDNLAPYRYFEPTKRRISTPAALKDDPATIVDEDGQDPVDSKMSILKTIRYIPITYNLIFPYFSIHCL